MEDYASVWGKSRLREQNAMYRIIDIPSFDARLSDLKKNLTILIGVLLALTMHASAAHAARMIPANQWITEPGDRLIVNVQTNWGYLFHERNADYFSFPVVTGQQRMIQYIGMHYFAATPTGHWTVMDDAIKTDHDTFGPTGYFLRLFDDSGRRTAYGIHGNAHSDTWLAQDIPYRFRSAGCIIVGDDVLSILKKSYAMNGNLLDIVTTGNQELIIEQVTEREAKDYAALTYK